MKVCLPFKDLNKPWYEAGRCYAEKGEPYPDHPDPCEDYNLETLGDSDLGEPLIACFAGIVITANYYPVWGNILRIMSIPVPAIPTGNMWWKEYAAGRYSNIGEIYVVKYAHLRDMYFRPGEVVAMGVVVGTVGKGADNRYSAHLHMEISKGSVPPAEMQGKRGGLYNFIQPSKFFATMDIEQKEIDNVVKFG